MRRKAAGKRHFPATQLFNVALQFALAAAQLLVKVTSTLQTSQCCSATSAVQHSENCSATSVFASGMLQGWGLSGGCTVPTKRLFKENAPFILFILLGPFARTLFSRTLPP